MSQIKLVLLQTNRKLETLSFSYPIFYLFIFFDSLVRSFISNKNDNNIINGG